MKDRVLLFTAVVTLAWITLVAPPESPASGTLVFGRGADSISLDPASYPDMESAKVVENIFEGLVRYEDNSTHIEPCLAVSWESSADGKEWTFHLRKGVVFHDGTPFNAEAVAFSLLRKTDPGHPFYRKEFAELDRSLKSIERVTVIDEHTIRLELQRPFAPFLSVLAMHSSFIVSPEAVRRMGDQFERNPVGTGPFQFVRWISGDRILLQRNENYWGIKPRLSNLIFLSIPSNRERLLKLKAGVIHAMDGIDPEAIQEIRKRHELGLDITPGLNVGYLAMNMEKKPFDQLEVRIAVNHAINKQSLVKLYYQELGIPAKTPLPPSLWGHNDAIKDYEYDPEKARELLKKAGYEQGFKTTLWVMSAPRPYMPQPEKLAQAVRANLSKVGITVQILMFDWNDFLAKICNGEHEMCLVGWVGDTGDPDNFLTYLFDKDSAVKPNAQNVSFFRDEDVHALLVEAQQNTDATTRERLYKEVQEIIHRQAPWLPLVHTQQAIAFRRKVSGMIQHPTGIVRFNRVRME